MFFRPSSRFVVLVAFLSVANAGPTLASVPYADRLSDSYEQARTRFFESARPILDRRRDAFIRRYPVSAPDATDLTIDTLYVPARVSPRNLIILISGIHGVEAVAGSVLQQIVMDKCVGDTGRGAGLDFAHTGLLVIHGMNPYGFKMGRRVNANNIDLNRNCFDHRTNQGPNFRGLSIANPEFRELKSLFDGPVCQLDIIWAALIHGQDKIAKGLSGQYEFPKSFYFGGQSVQPECRTVQDVMDGLIHQYRNIALFDVHTGLGKPGINQIMLNPPPSDAVDAFRLEVRLLKQMFPEAECEGVCEVQVSEAPEIAKSEDTGSHSFLTTGDVTQWIHDTYPRKRLEGRVISATAEIGSESERFVLEGLINENHCVQNPGRCSPRERAEKTQALRELFIPTRASWRSNVVRASRQMCLALGRFSRL